jgi:2-keto-3-deoxy-L-rhamnonate aldolase RhmA
MMEKKSLYDHLEDVMNLDGIDMIQFGSCDFAMALKLWGQTSHQKVREAEKNTIKMALKYDKHPRAEIESVFAEDFEKDLKRYKSLGVRDFSVGVDVVIQFEWVKKFGELTRKALEKI